MDSQRASKRRKLNVAEQRSSEKTPSPYSASAALAARKDGASNNGTNVSSSALANGTKENTAHKAWLDAKAQSIARRGKRLEGLPRKGGDTDVNKCTEGSHASQSPLKTKLLNSTPIKKHLDPLRNQKNVAATSSPSKSGSTLGFFKQFSQPKTGSAPNTPSRKGTTTEHVNGLSTTCMSHEKPHAQAGASSDSSSSSDEEDTPNETHSPLPPSAKGNMKGWAYELPKKTFEDEIRELALSAREDAGKEESSGAQIGSAQKLRDRTTVPKRQEVNVSSHPKAVASRAAPKKVPTSEIRKTKQARNVNTSEQFSGSVDDGLQIAKAFTPSKSDTEKSKTHPLPIHISTPTKQQSQLSVPSQPPLKETTFAQEHLACIQKILLEKLTGKRPSRLVNLDEEYAKISNLITQTITAGESNSMLVIGSRGSGKSAIVDQILREQSVEHANDFHVVRLNGFIHTDDKIALREIWRQLGREMELDEEECTAKNLADTLTTLLALLSHPAEHGREEIGQVIKSVIFILDEFELFASHPRQTLLYNLFDIAQSRKAPIAVLGLTTRIDVVESLEKRVKSRFSHRYVHLSSAKSLAAFEEACKSAILIHPSDLSSEERGQLDLSSELTTKLQGASYKQKIDVAQDWNATVEALISDEAFQDHLRRLYYTTKSVPDFQTSTLLAISTLPTDSKAKNTDIVSHLTAALSPHALQPPDSKLSLLPSLSTLQLALLICAARLTNIHNMDNVPFAQAYEEYKVLASKAKLQASASGALAQGAGSRVWGKEVAKGAWEDLVEFGLAMEDGSRGSRVEVGLEEIGMSGCELGAWGRWCKEI